MSLDTLLSERPYALIVVVCLGIGLPLGGHVAIASPVWAKQPVGNLKRPQWMIIRGLPDGHYRIQVIAVSQFGGNGFYSCKVADDRLGHFYLDDLIANGVIPKPTVHKFPGSRETGYTRQEWNEILAGLQFRRWPESAVGVQRVVDRRGARLARCLLCQLA